MGDEPSDRIESGSPELPEVLRTLAGVLPQFDGEVLEGQLQTFDAFLGILAPSVRPRVAGLLSEAAARARTSSTRARLETAAESITRGGRAAEPYDHAKAMQSYQESFRKDNPEPEPRPDKETPSAQPRGESSALSDEGSFREKWKRRAIIMEIGGFRPSENPKTSWFGKVAFGLPGEEWPMLDEATPMVPLAQVNLAELPFRPPHLEDVEFLAVFVGPDSLGDDFNGSTWSLRAYPSVDALVPLEIPEKLESQIKALPMRPKVIEEDYPCHDDVADDVPDDLEDGYENDFENVSGFKLGGWPSLIQGRIDSPAQSEATRPEYVFQIDSTEKGRWSWGDGGVGYFARGTTPGHENEWFLTSQFY